MTTTTEREPESRIDCDACRKRLQAITTDPAMLASFDRMVESQAAGEAEAFNDPAKMTRWNDAMGGFLADAARLNISLDYIFGGRGEPFMSPEGVS